MISQKTWSIVLAVAIVAVVVGWGVYVWQAQKLTGTVAAEQNTKTYTSSEFKYSLEYPEDWFLESIQMGEAQPEVVWISKQEIQEGTGPDVELSISINRSSLEDNIGKNFKIPEDILFADRSAKKFSYTNDFSEPATAIIFVPVNRYTFVISYNPEDQDIASIEGILNSFTFTDDLATEDGSSPQPVVFESLKYGFTLTFPSTWKDYTTKSRTIKWGGYGSNDSIDFGFPVQEALFNLGIHPKNQWQALQSEEGPIPAYLGESNDYIFSYSTGQYAANDEMVARMGEVKDIVKTFALQPTDKKTDKKNVPVTKESLEVYFAERKEFERSGMTKNPNEYGFKELAKVAVTCPDSLGTPCAGDLLILSLDYGTQEFYLGFTSGTGYKYYGIFIDDLQKIVDEAKATKSLERSY